MLRFLLRSLSKTAWEIISNDKILLDEIAYCLTVHKDDPSIRAALAPKFGERHLDAKLIEPLLNVSFSKFQHLSTEAMQKMIPHLENGMKYSDACTAAGYCHFKPQEGERSEYLPPLETEEIRNPVVVRSLAQVRKVVNAIVRKFGSPEEVHIELARDISKPFEERKKIEREQNENRNERERVKADLMTTFRLGNPNGRDILKFRLAKEQNYECAYSGKPLDRNRIFDDNYTEIDHIIPYSRCFNDGYTNKVLVLSEENRNKRNRTPFEYMGANEERWDKFTSWVNSIKSLRAAKKRNLLQEEFDEEEKKQRYLSDTRYITRFAADWIREGLKFSDPDKKSPVVCVKGQFTANLRGKWGLADLKDREGSDVHHALDAAVVAAVLPHMNERIAQHYKDIEQDKRSLTPTGDRKLPPFPTPWQGFRHELRVLLSPAPQEVLKSIELSHYTEEEKAQIKKIFVSKMPTRKSTGEAHAETIRSTKPRKPGEQLRGCVSKVRLEDMKLATLENMVGKERDFKLYEALKQRLEANGNDPKKAFSEPFRKPTTEPDKEAPIVRTIKVYDNTLSGIEIRGGLAGNGEMVRVDVYTKDKKFFLVPHYVDDIAKRIVKKHAIFQGKEEKDWTKIDESYKFCFSLFKNDLLRVVNSKAEETLGYYVGTHRGTGNITISAHDGSWIKEGLGPKTLKIFEKYTVSPLGEYWRVKHENPPFGKEIES